MTDSISYRTLVPPRITAITGIVALHLLIAYLLLTALVQPPPKEAPPPAITAWFTPDPPRIPPAQTPPRARDIDFARPRPRDVRSPDRIVTEPVHPDVPVVTGTAEPPAPPSPARQEEPIRVLGRHWLPSSEAYYPPDLIRNGVQGDTQVRACVDESGRLAGDPVLEQSSGNARLDQGALKVARAGRYARAVRGGTPVPNCYHFHIVFRMK